MSGGTIFLLFVAALLLAAAVFLKPLARRPKIDRDFGEPLPRERRSHRSRRR